MGEDARQRSIIYIVVGNLVVLLLIVVGWFVMRKLRVGREPKPEMQLNVPKK